MKIALLHRHTAKDIKQTNAAFPYLAKKGMDVLTFKKFNRIGKMKWIKSFLWIIYAPFLVEGKGYDVIYCDDSFPFYAGLVKHFCPKSKVVLRLGDIHLLYYIQGWKYRLLHKLEKWSWRKVDRIIAISKTMAEYLREEVKTPVDVVFDPVDPKDFKCDAEAESKNIIMFHGTLTKNKGLDIILEAARKLPDYEFVIVGDGEDCERLAKNKPDNVFMSGWIKPEQLKWHLNIADIGLAIRSKNPGNEFVVTSPWLQYGVMGIPCIVSRRRVFEDMDYPYQYSNIHDLVFWINYLIEHKDAKFGEKWQKYILKKHDAKKVAYQIWAILEKEGGK